jgi:hypothetical protein
VSAAVHLLGQSGCLIASGCVEEIRGLVPGDNHEMLAIGAELIEGHVGGKGELVHPILGSQVVNFQLI